MFKKKPDPRLVEIETENKQLRLEIKKLKRENAELREEIDKLKQYESITSTRPQPEVSVAESRPNTDSELQKRLSKTMKQLSDVQERLTILEQVTAATQRREMIQEGVYHQNLPSHSEYEQLRFDLTQEPVYAKLQLTTHRGNTVFSRLVVVRNFLTWVEGLIFSHCHFSFSLPDLRHSSLSGPPPLSEVESWVLSVVEKTHTFRFRPYLLNFYAGKKVRNLASIFNQVAFESL